MKILLNIIKTIVLFVLMFILSDGKTQSFNYFNNRYDISEDGLRDDCIAIVGSEEGIVVAGTSLVISGNIYWWEQKLTMLDENGIVKYIKTYGEDSLDFYFTSSRCLINADKHFYAVAKIRTPNSILAHNEGTLMYLDENLDTLWMRRYGEKKEPYDTAYLFTCLQKIGPNELIISGSWMPYGLPSRAYLLKTDSIGNKIWDNSYSYYNSYIEAYSIVQSSDSGFILGCFKQTPGYPYTVDPIIIKTDGHGNQEWTKNLGGPEKDFIPMVALSDDGNILVGTSYADSMLTPDIPISKINIIKLDNNGNILWSKKYGSSQENCFLRNLIVLDDGSILSVGGVSKYNPEPDRVAWILKTTSAGDSLWYREYKFLSGYESYNELFSMIETSDNGLIACGFVMPSEPDTGSVDTWIIKLDSIGCEFAGCDTTVWINEHGGMEAWGHGGMEIWPNPAREILNFKFSV
jgi:hypothetical protein